MAESEILTRNISCWCGAFPLRYANCEICQQEDKSSLLNHEEFFGIPWYSPKHFELFFEDDAQIRCHEAVFRFEIKIQDYLRVGNHVFQYPRGIKLT